jgi:conjugation transfer TcpE-like protein
MDDDAGAEILCATYTHARRHPMVLGQIGGWTPPFQLTMTQLAVLIITFLVETQTWRWWGVFLPRMAGVIVAIGLPCLLAWVVRRTRIEGRSLPRFVAGWFVYAAMPRRGKAGGRPYRPAKPLWPYYERIYVTAGEPEETW